MYFSFKRLSRPCCGAAFLAGLVAWCVSAVAQDVPRFDSEIAPLLKSRCVKCHGPATREAGLYLSTPAGIARGGKSGPVVAPHDPAASRLWEKIAADEMPPDEPLTEAERSTIRRWILAGAPGLAAARAGAAVEADHWAFRPLIRPPLPAVNNRERVYTPIDQFVQAALEPAGLAIGPDAEGRTLARRVHVAITGLPPLGEDRADLRSDASALNFEELVERWLASPQFGPRWAKYWLDAAGYADSNGYFGADTDRPLAYRYRDYVVRSLNADKPFDRFVREQLAGDELARFTAGRPATPADIELLEATHFLRNGQDGTGESDGNPDEVRADRYYALESCQQIVAGSLLALTVQCAKCHDHKFEPITQRDFYRLQALFYPAFPLETWVKPNDRFVHAALPGEMEAWENRLQLLDRQLAGQRTALDAWIRENRPAGEQLFADGFESAAGPVTERWGATAPGDDAPGGVVPVRLEGEQPPVARVRDGALQIVEGGTAGNSWLSTKAGFDWTPDAPGDAIQATFDLVDVRLDAQGAPAGRIGYYLALHDYHDNSSVGGGNILIDGHPASSTAVHTDYPGADSKSAGQIGVTGYQAGRNYGVRVTNIGEGKFRLEHLVDGAPEDKSLTLVAADLPDGGFGFEYCCGRSFIVDNVRVERFRAANDGAGGAAAKQLAAFHEQLKQRRRTFDELAKDRAALAADKPGRIAWLTDVAPTPPDVYLLTRGNYAARGEKIEPGVPAVLSDPENAFSVAPPEPGRRTTGRRLAFASWLTRADSRPAALLARVHVNRIWQHYFGAGLVATPDNLGLGGAPPSHPELLEWLAAELVASGWQTKEIHRGILQSATFRQSSAVSPAARERDPSNRLLSRFPLLRLDAEAIRDGMLAASGELDLRLGGPYVPTARDGDGEVMVDEASPGVRRRSLYLYQRRTQVVSFLTVFDAPSIVFHSAQRTRSTTPLQSLALWNAPFVLNRSEAFAQRLEREANDDGARLALLMEIALSRRMSPEERARGLQFLDEQTAAHQPRADARRRAWIDLVQAVLASNGFLYLE